MYDCGALCTANSTVCTDTVMKIVEDVIDLVVEIEGAFDGDIDVMSIA